jgi:glycerol-3-phosphate acyltransferase PlsY
MTKKDVTKEGSGNVGTLNAYTVSRSKLIGVIVLITDLLKGAIPIFVLYMFTELSGMFLALPAIMLLIGHNYSVFLKFKGGRGLAVTAGMFLVLNIFLLITWCVIWSIIFLIKRDILVSNYTATLFLSLPVYLFNDLYDKFTVSSLNNSLLILTIVISIIILLRHSEVFSLLKSKKT